MKRIPSARRTWFVALGVAVALAALARWLPDHEGRHGDYGLAEAAAERGATEPGQAAERPVRRVRASTAMPYFSFAQSLRPRG